LAIWIARKISLPIGEVKEVAQRIAAGDLTTKEIAVRSKDEVGELAKSINDMQANLRNIVRSIAENAQNVANASEEFSAVSEQIGASSEETSAQANAVSATTEEVNRGLQTVATATEEMSGAFRKLPRMPQKRRRWQTAR
jgi:methyl-accepting chemotaxis protein